MRFVFFVGLLGWVGLAYAIPPRVAEQPWVRKFKVTQAGAPLAPVRFEIKKIGQVVVVPHTLERCPTGTEPTFVVQTTLPPGWLDTRVHRWLRPVAARLAPAVGFGKSWGVVYLYDYPKVENAIRVFCFPSPVRQKPPVPLYRHGWLHFYSGSFEPGSTRAVVPYVHIRLPSRYITFMYRDGIFPN